MHVIGGWSDWVASLQIITRNLHAVGIDANVKLEPDWGAWQPNAMSTKFVTLLWNYGGGDVTPYAYFYSHYDPSQNLGAGVDAVADGNWEHYSNAEGAALLKQFKGTLDPGQAEGDRLQAAVDLPRRAAVRAAVHRPAVVDLQHEVLHGLGSRGRTSTSIRSSPPSSRWRRSCSRLHPVEGHGVTTTRNRPFGVGGAGSMPPADPDVGSSLRGRRQAGSCTRHAACISGPRRTRPLG